MRTHEWAGRQGSAGRGRTGLRREGSWRAVLVIATLCSIAHSEVVVRRARRVLSAVAALAPRPQEPIDEPVTVLVPARNEAPVIDACLTGLRAQTHGRRSGSGALHIVVVDDASGDATGEIVDRHAALDARVTVCRTDGPPPGWVGKVHALAVGLASGPRSREGWVLAVDADVVLAPEAIERLLATARAGDLDLVSTPGGPPPGASLSWPLLMPGGLGVIAAYAAPDGRGRRALAIGHCLLVRRGTLESVGGWAALSGRRGEDIALATRIRDRGGRTRLVDGMDVVTTSGMDPLRAGWVSFRKSFVAATHDRAGLLLLGGLIQIVLALSGPALLLVASRSPALPLRALGAAGWSAQMLTHAHTAAFMRARPVLAPLAPVSGVAIGLVLIDGARSVVAGTNTWKGRRPQAVRRAGLTGSAS